MEFEPGVEIVGDVKFVAQGVRNEKGPLGHLPGWGDRVIEVGVVCQPLQPNKVPEKPEPEVKHSAPGVANLFLINPRQEPGAHVVSDLRG